MLPRISAVIFALLLASQSVWLIAAEFVRPTLHFFPANGAEANLIAPTVLAAEMGAKIAWPRGPAWADYAVAANAPFIADLEEYTQNPAKRPVDSVSETAATLAPLDPRPWLLLAAASQHAGSTNSDATQARLKLSYYTSAYDQRLFPFRVRIAAQSAADPDDELRGLVDDEIGHWLRARPELTRPIALAFRNATPAGRRLLEVAIGRHNPALLSELRNAYR